MAQARDKIFFFGFNDRENRPLHVDPPEAQRRRDARASGLQPGPAVTADSARPDTVLPRLVHNDAEDVAYAKKCIDANGGVEGLHASWYEEGNVERSGAFQIFRLEGPAAVFYFRGYPHVHAFINVAMNAEAPLSVGDLVGENPAPMEGPALKAIFEDALQSATGSELGCCCPSP